MITFLKKYFPVLFILILVGVFFYKTFIYNLIPFPGDMLVGAYYPWLDYKWGSFVTSVPIKNPLISDVFSQFFIWKKIIADSIKNLQFPFWNIYSYSGYPLYANFHSGVLNPFNLLMVFFSQSCGWTLLVISQFLFSGLTMYLFLKKIYSKSLYAPLAGSITYAFSGFMITWSQFVTAGFAMIWLPLIFLNIENYFDTKKVKYILYLSILYFLTMTSGHIQALIYTFIISFCYFIYKYLKNNSTQKIYKLYWYALALFLSFLLMAIQLIPTIEMGKYSVRFEENYISGYNYGLLSLDRIVTLFAPDYFGNPTTFNFWGSFNYHETVSYSSILAIFALIFCIYNYKKLKNERFFLYVAIISLILVFDTFLGRMIYNFKIPLISTSAAGRLIFIYTFCISVLVAYFIKHLSIHNFKNTLRYYWGYFVYLGLVVLLTFLSYKNTLPVIDLQNNYSVAIRNLVIPLLISVCIIFVLIFIKNIKAKNILLIIILVIDLFRFGWKYLPFTSKDYLYPDTEITNYLKSDKTLFRIEKEKGPLMTPNVWSFYELQSTAGYDPMAIRDYSIFYQNKLNKQINGGSSRYSELDNYDPELLGEGNVKYLLALNYDDIDKISSDGQNLNYKIDKEEWEEVCRHKSVSILKNTKYKERLEVFDDQKANIKNIVYTPNKISIDVDTTTTNASLILRDTWYPGWKALINGKLVNIEKYQNIYRQINLIKGSNHVEFIYSPKFFYLGLCLSSIGAIILALLLYIKSKKNES